MTIQGLPAPVSSAQTFTRPLPVVPGTNVFTITATDASGNTATARYEVDVSDAPKTFTYDANGNLTSDGTRTFEWDARNQLVAVTVGTHRSEFVYDGLQRRVRQIEQENGVTTADTRVLWCETVICEERAADGVTVTRRAFGVGEQINGTARYFTTDHLGSVREVTDTVGTLLARYAFDPWGRRTVTAGTDVTTVGFTGHRTHTNSELALALYRGYDPGLGRWVSEDPWEAGAFTTDGPSLYQYVRNRPISLVDPLGLWAAGGGAVVGIAAGVFGVGGYADASCVFVFDGDGNSGVMCCAGTGWAGGVGLIGGPSGTGLFCHGCKTICDLPSRYVQAQVMLAAGAGPAGGASGAASTSGLTLGASYGKRGGAGFLITAGGGTCRLVWSRKGCDTCQP